MVIWCRLVLLVIMLRMGFMFSVGIIVWVVMNVVVWGGFMLGMIIYVFLVLMIVVVVVNLMFDGVCLIWFVEVRCVLLMNFMNVGLRCMV